MLEVEGFCQIKNIGELAAHPNQKIVVYKGELLVINWNFPTQQIKIQYYDLNLKPEDDRDLCKTICKNQPGSLERDYKRLYDERRFSDVIFEVEGEEIPAHKTILAYRSDYFMKMFTSRVIDKEEASNLSYRWNEGVT